MPIRRAEPKDSVEPSGVAVSNALLLMRAIVEGIAQWELPPGAIYGGPITGGIIRMGNNRIPCSLDEHGLPILTSGVHPELTYRLEQLQQVKKGNYLPR